MNRPAAERIALLFAIPVSRRELDERLAIAQWDYGRTVFLSGCSVTEIFDRVYAPLCEAATDLMDRATHAGVTIRRCATLTDLKKASREHEVVVLVAHWRGSQIAEDDWLDGWRARAVACDRSTVIGNVVAQTGDRATMTVALNDLIAGRRLVHLLPGGIGESILADPVVIEALSRDLVDEFFEGVLRPGNMLELTDGLRGMGAVNNAIATQPMRVLDLSCCTSAVLGTYLKLERGDSLDVIMGDQFIVPEPQLRLIDAVLELLEREPGLTYAVARRQIARALGDWRREQEATIQKERKQA